MILRFLGHAAFALRLGGVRFCLDPHKPGVLGGRMQLPKIIGPFDAIASTHGHEDHAAWTPELGTTQRLDQDGDFRGVALTTRPACHDQRLGVHMGLVRMLSLTAEMQRVTHCGDLSAYNNSDIEWLRGTSVLLVPVGGKYTLDGLQAADLTRHVAPKWVVPMHAADPRVDLPLADVQAFVAALQWPTLKAAELSENTPPGLVLLTPP